MAAGTNWFTRAVRGLRSFAYPEDGARPKVGLALGGGFARGIAHLGVLRVFEENEIPMDYIAGTSVGALIAAAYASGASLDFMEIQGSTTTFHDFGRWTLSRYGMASNARLEIFLHRFTSADSFDQMKIPLSIVATDLVSGKSVHFTDGEIIPALRASCAYPGLFLPVEYRGHFLADGFLTEAAPAEAVRELGAELVISVNLEPELLGERPRNTIEVISRSFSIMQTHLVQPWRAQTDILIEPNVNNVLWNEFAKTPQLVASGRAAAEAVLPKIKAALRANQAERARQSARAQIRK
ncbi:MAG: patatin-like phospholipase family protein [Candidatus Acidiferrales bacterium]